MFVAVDTTTGATLAQTSSTTHGPVYPLKNGTSLIPPHPSAKRGAGAVFIGDNFYMGFGLNSFFGSGTVSGDRANCGGTRRKTKLGSSWQMEAPALSARSSQPCGFPNLPFGFSEIKLKRILLLCIVCTFPFSSKKKKKHETVCSLAKKKKNVRARFK